MKEVATMGNTFLHFSKLRHGNWKNNVQLSAHIPVLVVSSGYEQAPELEYMIGGECDGSALSFHPSPQGNRIF
jgi:hypothetical protein